MFADQPAQDATRNSQAVRVPYLDRRIKATALVRYIDLPGPAPRTRRAIVAEQFGADQGIDPGVARIGNTAYAIESKGRFLFDPKLKGQDPGAFALRAVPIGGVQ